MTDPKHLSHVPADQLADGNADIDPSTLVRSLRDALAAHGVKAPSLGLDGPSMFHPYVPTLIELGCITKENARRLIQALAGPRPAVNG
ncbi:hypothetical protein RM844_17720 [Streptomyces sp. DSM 44915]|uniref:Uncharacterized protein n=1 Tax=Streptomyces chisholmiae TaxID=3075540 RepID=A0ABU2JT11_9ACTN|nr:hypothetical protein [Streptomyces sp. DSM 44915]MDT0268124.1 hypothetical protein [Streptomyces sp. DSM 44915]